MNRNVLIIILHIGTLLVVVQETNCQDCQDRESYWTCYSWLQYGYCDAPGYRRTMYRLCRRSCDLCHLVRRVTTTKRPTTPAPVTAAPPPPKPENCKDNNNYCVRYQTYGYCDKTSIYYQFMVQKCPKTCGFCKGVCKDDNSNCARWSNYCVRTGEYWTFMKKNCPKTCKICDDVETGTGGKKKEKKDTQFECDFEKDFCHWNNEHHDDIVDWAVGTDTDGPANGAKGSRSYLYLDTKISTYKGRLILPWVLVMPLKEMKKRIMCFTFKYNMRRGYMRVYEQQIPSMNDYTPKAKTLLTLTTDSPSWKEVKVTATMDSMHMLYIEAHKTGLRSNIGIDDIAFYSGSC